MKFKFLTGDANWLQYGAKWISSKLNNGDFDYWLVIEFINMNDACGSDNIGQPPYHVSLSAVSPSQAGDANLKKAFDSCGWSGQEDFFDHAAKVECLHSYGISATIWQSNGSNSKSLLRQAKSQAQLSEGLFGFFMDSPKNKIGTTGWEAIKGDLDSALARTIASGSTEGNILAKIYGVTTN